MENLKDVKGKVQTALAIIINIAHKSKLLDLKHRAEDLEQMVNDYDLYEQIFDAVAFQELCGHVTDRNYEIAYHWAEVLAMYVEGLVDKVEVRYGMTYTLGTDRVTIVQSLKTTNVLMIEVSPGITPMA